MSQPLQHNGNENTKDNDAKSGAIQVAYLGPEASFSHQAALNVFAPGLSYVSKSSSLPSSRSISPINLTPVPSFTAIFSAVQSRSHNYAVIPFENSTNGSVVQVLDLLAQCGLDNSASYPDLEICAEHYLAVHQCLLVSGTTTQNLPASDASRTDRNGQFIADKAESSRFADIKVLYTHPQAWGQCNKFLSTHFTGIERIDVGSTSAAAQIAAKDVSGQSAAIASKLASKMHNLNCLAENIEDDPSANTTRFLVMRNRRAEVLSISPNQIHIPQDRRSHLNHKSLLTFTIPHSLPGSLADALAVFKQFNFNLTSIETRPSRQRNWHYVFFVECEENWQLGTCGDVENSDLGHDNVTPDEDGPLKHDSIANLPEMLEVLQRQTETMRYLGSWIDMLQYRS